VKFGALSNACAAYVQGVFHVNEVNDLFEAGIGFDTTNIAKPKPDGLFKLCEMMNLEPKNCIYIGDAPTDGQAGKAAGMQTIGVTWGSFPKDRVVGSFDHVVHDINGLKDKIEYCLSRRDAKSKSNLILTQ
jgi:phosphoglycolate phosphatase-like HAD superfamily hydrolase